MAGKLVANHGEISVRIPRFGKVRLLGLVLALGVLLGSGLGYGCSWPPAVDTTTSTVAVSVPTSTPPTIAVSSSSTTTVIARPTTTSTLATTTTIRRQAVPGDPQAIAAKLQKSVVGVTALVLSTKTQRLQSVGTGVVVKAEDGVALIVTNDHVIAREDGSAAKQITVRLPSGSTVSATLVGRDPNTDVALLRVRSRKVEAATFRPDLSTVAVGDWVVAIGNRKILKQPVTTGHITALLQGVEVRGLPGVDAVIESTVPLAHGNSGGPLVDVDGWVIGINTGQLEGEGLALTLPCDLVWEVVARLLGASE